MIDVVICPLCAVEIHRHTEEQVVLRLAMPSRTTEGGDALTMLAERALQEKVAEMMAAEKACVTHYADRHCYRFWLWCHLKWDWLMRWPTKKREPRVDEKIFDPLQFIPRDS